MMEKTLKDLIADSEKICDLLYTNNVGNCKARPASLRVELHHELLKYAIYLADADDILTQHEVNVMEEYLGVHVDLVMVEQVKQSDSLEMLYPKERPSIFKYAVLADAGRKITPDPFHNQKAQLLYDTYNQFGQLIVANKPDVSSGAVQRYTQYMQMLDKFLREYGVNFTSSMKFYKIVKTPSGNSEINGTPAMGKTGGQVPKNVQRIMPAEKVKQPDVAPALTPEERIDKALETLDNLVGLEGVKEEVHSLVNLMKVRKLREEKGMKNTGISMHMVFSGNPGTGKTTVARMLAQIYEALGVLSGGQLVEVDRSGLVRGFIGQTATRVQEVVDESLGGILFVDEAYALCVGKGEGDFGQEAIDTLLKAMEDHRDDLVVIVAGYPDLMEEFLNSNPGLKSRFSKFVFFEDYTPEEQLKILKSMCKKQDYQLTKEAEERAYAWMQERFKNRSANFANARDVRNFMEKAISKQAGRIVEVQKPTKKMLATIELEDVEAVIADSTLKEHTTE